jgi:nucleoid-associated protein YgaU
MSLRDKYAWAIQTAKKIGMQGSADERDGKLYFHGTVENDDQVNEIWNAIKTIPDWRNDIVADIKSTGGPATNAAPASPQANATYTVKSGDTLSKIAKETLGSADRFLDIFNANRDQLDNPDKIKPGQVLKIPQHATR